MSQSKDMGKRQAEAHPTSPRPKDERDSPAEVWRTKQEREVLERGSPTDEEAGVAGIQRKEPGDKPLTDNGERR